MSFSDHILFTLMSRVICWHNSQRKQKVQATIITNTTTTTISTAINTNITPTTNGSNGTRKITIYTTITLHVT